MEVWKDIKGYEGLYQVSSLGRVKSLNYHRTGQEKVLKETPLHKNAQNDYLRVHLSKDGKGEYYRIHILVAEAFIPNPQNLPEVNHKDENKKNNSIDNLEWCTKEYNLKYGTRNKRMAKTKSKSILQYTLDGQLVKEWSSMNDVKRELGLSTGNITSCCKGTRNSTGGYIWKYKQVS